MIQNLGELTGKVLTLLGRENEAIVDARRVCGSNEFNGIIGRSTEKAIRLVFSEAQVTPQQFVSELQARTSEKYVYFSGLLWVSDICDLRYRKGWQ